MLAGGPCETRRTPSTTATRPFAAHTQPPATGHPSPLPLHRHLQIVKWPPLLHLHPRHHHHHHPHRRARPRHPLPVARASPPLATLTLTVLIPPTRRTRRLPPQRRHTRPQWPQRCVCPCGCHYTSRQACQCESLCAGRTAAMAVARRPTQGLAGDRGSGRYRPRRRQGGRALRHNSGARRAARRAPAAAAGAHAHESAPHCGWQPVSDAVQARVATSHTRKSLAPYTTESAGRVTGISLTGRRSGICDASASRRQWWWPPSLSHARTSLLLLLPPPPPQSHGSRAQSPIAGRGQGSCHPRGGGAQGPCAAPQRSQGDREWLATAASRPLPNHARSPAPVPGPHRTHWWWRCTPRRASVRESPLQRPTNGQPACHTCVCSAARPSHRAICIGGSYTQYQDPQYRMGGAI